MRGLTRTAHQERQLRRQCQDALDGLGVGAPYDLPDLIKHLASVRGRPVHVASLTAEAATSDRCSGLWLSTETEDWIFADPTSDGEERDLIIGHELGHIILDHPPDVTISNWDLRRLAPTLDPDRVRSALRRANYDTQSEREAETLGTLILTGRAGSRTAMPIEGSLSAPQATAVLARLSHVLG